jgi:hypothetical protein
MVCQPPARRTIVLQYRESEGAVSRYKVQIADTGDDKRISGVFATADEAVAACKLIVDECLKPMVQPGMTAAALYRQYERFGEDPFVVPVDPNDAPAAFTASNYAKQRCQVLGAKPPILIPADEDMTAQYTGTIISIVGVKPPP